MLFQRKSIAVRPTLQLADGTDFVFAIGDCCDTDEEKNALTADLNATLAAKNILKLLQGGGHDEQQLLRYPQDVCFGLEQSPSIACVSLGPWSAVMQLQWLVVGGILAAFVKVLIETMQTEIAHGSKFFAWLWALMEHLNVWVCATLLGPTTRKK